MIKNRRLHEITFVEAVARGAFAAANQSRTVFATNIQVFEHCLELTLIDARTHFRLRIHAVADAHRLRAFRDALNEFVSDLIDHNCATRGGASLARRSERALRGIFNGEIHVAVFKNHDRILTAHLALTLCAAPRNLFVKSNADRIRSCERDRLDRRMIDDFVARVGA